MSCGWFYNDTSGVVRYDCGISYLADLAARAAGVGWSGPYKTEAEAMAHKGVQGAQATTNTNPVTAATTAVTGSLIPSLFTQRGFAQRVVEVILGGVLVIIGVRALL